MPLFIVIALIIVLCIARKMKKAKIQNDSVQKMEEVEVQKESSESSTLNRIASAGEKMQNAGKKIEKAGKSITSIIFCVVILVILLVIIVAAITS